MLRPLLRDDQWDRIKGLLAGKRGDPGERRRGTTACSWRRCCSGACGWVRYCVAGSTATAGASGAMEGWCMRKNSRSGRRWQPRLRKPPSPAVGRRSPRFSISATTPKGSSPGRETWSVAMAARASGRSAILASFLRGFPRATDTI